MIPKWCHVLTIIRLVVSCVETTSIVVSCVAGSFVETLIEAHAAQCRLHEPALAVALRIGSQPSSADAYIDSVATSLGDNTNHDVEGECPVCGISLPLAFLQVHVNACVDAMF